MIAREHSVSVSHPLAVESVSTNDANARYRGVKECWSAVRQAFGYAPAPTRRWVISDSEQLSLDGGLLTVFESANRYARAQGEHAWRLSEIAGAMFPSAGKEKDIVDVMLLVRGKRPEGLQQEYAGSLRTTSDAYKRVRKTLRDLRIA